MKLFGAEISADELRNLGIAPPAENAVIGGTHHLRWLSPESCRLRQYWPIACLIPSLLMLLWGSALLYGVVSQVVNGRFDPTIFRAFLFGMLLLFWGAIFFYRPSIRVDGQNQEIEFPRGIFLRDRLAVDDISSITLWLDDSTCRIDIQTREGTPRTFECETGQSTGIDATVRFACWLATQFCMPLTLLVASSVSIDSPTVQVIERLLETGRKWEEEW